MWYACSVAIGAFVSCLFRIVLTNFFIVFICKGVYRLPIFTCVSCAISPLPQYHIPLKDA